MADVTSSLSQIGTQFKSAVGTSGVYIMYTVLLIVFFIVIGVVLWYYMNKKSYNVSVVILRPRAGSTVFDYETGKVGKQFFDKAKKEVRFRIYQAKKFGMQYNEEAVDQKYFIKRFVGGKYNPLLFMAPNEQGWLQPVMMNLDTSNGIIASVSNADLSYYQTELELMDSLFSNKSFFEKYYLIILIFLMIVVVCIQWYSAAQIHKAAQINLQAVQLLTDTALRIAANAGNVTQVLPVG